MAEVATAEPIQEVAQVKRSIPTLAETEKNAILAAYRQLNRDKLLTARVLGIGKTTLYRKLKEYGVE